MRAAEPGNEIESIYSGQAQVGENDVIIAFADVRIHDVLLTDEGLVVTLKRAFPGHTSLRETHEEMSELERTLKSLIPELARVHIDPEISNPD